MSDPAILVKICGLTCVEDARFCAEMGADWIGLNFHPASPRSVDRRLAQEIIGALPDTVTVAGVFVDRPPREVAEVAESLGLDVVQLHGQEPADDLLRLPAGRGIRAFRPVDPPDWGGILDYLARAEALGRPLAGVLVDAFVPGQPGGTGALIADGILDSRPTLPRLILAGGLTPRNVADRIARYRPWMVDVASGVESSPGRKDRGLVAAFIRAARGPRGAEGGPPPDSGPTVEVSPRAADLS